MSISTPPVAPPPGGNAPAATSPQPSALVDRYLAEQQVTAAARFARAHDAARDAGPALAGRYSALMPATPPAPGQQYAFDVDLDACSGCKSCVAACHALNGLEEEESWRDVGLLHGGSQRLPVVQHVTTACHHCLDPACMHACPVDAYEKDPATGIVKHLDDQCFGCQYCTLACPYEAPKYSRAKGIVRKCDMCGDRLADGEAPACVQSCPNGAIAIRVVDIEQVVEESETNLFVPGAPEPSLTLPTTAYRTTRVLPRNMVPADYHTVHPERAHWPLIVMLALTQLSVGAFLVERLLELAVPGPLAAGIRPVHSASALVFGLLALAVSVLHLGRPRYAYRAVLGLRHSWLSREIVAFGTFAALAVLYAVWSWPGAAVWLDRWGLATASGPDTGSGPWLGWGVALSGTAGVLCSVMVYAYTKRDFWNGPATACRFLLTAAVLGLAAAWLPLLLIVAVGGDARLATAAVDNYGTLLCRGLIAATAAKLLFEALLFRHLAARSTTSLKRTARLMTGTLSNVTLARFAAGLLGGLAMPALLLVSRVPTHPDHGQDVVFAVLVGMLFVACLAGELLERYLFFAAVASPRMPGTL
ncbi:MAG: dimethyl sulfoxide reductase anchor subunit [Acidobacteria bacterium]|nr:dimethyl sulfoxide reductase anchor subunit [Acidobacteriota bacterium]